MKKFRKVLASLAILGMIITMAPINAFAVAFGGIPDPRHVSGTTAAQTAVQIIREESLYGWGDPIASTPTIPSGTAILASSESYARTDALAAGPLATYLKAPILLQEAGATLNADTKDALTQYNIKTVYVISGTAVIKQSVINELKGMGITVIPLGGVDKYETSVNIAKQMVGVTKVAVVDSVPDALSIAPIASAANEPILLTDKDSIPVSVAGYLATTTDSANTTGSAITSSDVIGGTEVISDAVVAQLPSSTRHFGQTAYDTNSQVIQDFSSVLRFGNVYIANGVTGIDALAGAPLAAITNSPIELTDGQNVPNVALYINSKSSGYAMIALGGKAVVPDAILHGSVFNYVPTK